MVIEFNKLTILLFLGIIKKLFETVSIRPEINNQFLVALQEVYMLNIFFGELVANLREKFTLKI